MEGHGGSSQMEHVSNQQVLANHLRKRDLVTQNCCDTGGAGWLEVHRFLFCRYQVCAPQMLCFWDGPLKLFIFPLNSHLEDGYCTLAVLTSKAGICGPKIRPKLHMMAHLLLLDL